jgi:hypothetical protein
LAQLPLRPSAAHLAAAPHARAPVADGRGPLVIPSLAPPLQPRPSRGRARLGVRALRPALSSPLDGKPAPLFKALNRTTSRAPKP